MTDKYDIVKPDPSAKKSYQTTLDNYFSKNVTSNSITTAISSSSSQVFKVHTNIETNSTSTPEPTTKLTQVGAVSQPLVECESPLDFLSTLASHPPSDSLVKFNLGADSNGITLQGPNQSIFNYLKPVVHTSVAPLGKPEIIEISSDGPIPENIIQEVEEVEEAFEVELVLASRVNQTKGIQEYLLKWKGYPNDSNLWVPKQELNCTELVKIFKKSTKAQAEPDNLKTPYDPTGYTTTDVIKNLYYLPTHVTEMLLLVNIDNGPPISVINGIDTLGPPADFKYITSMIYSEGVPKPNELFMPGCLCSKNCRSHQKCFCYPVGTEYPYTPSGLLSRDLGHAIFECNVNCSCKLSCVNRITQRETLANLQLFKSVNKGWGMRTTNSLEKGTFVGEYLGELITNEEAEKRGVDYDEKGNSYLFDLDYNNGPSHDCQYVIDAYRYGNFTHFFNHSCEPNMAVYSVFFGHQSADIYKLCFFTIKKVKEGEELCFDYSSGHELHTSKEDEEVDPVKAEEIRLRNEKYKCYCMAKKCRGYVHMY